MNLPNKLTMGRIFAILVFIVVFLMGYRYAAAIVFVLAAITDMMGISPESITLLQTSAS